MLSRRVLRSFKVGARHNSTVSTMDKVIKKPIRLERLGNIVIPSAAEINAKKAAVQPEYQADISYLKDAPKKFLSARLMQMESESDPSPVSAEQIAEITERRKQERMAREAAQVESHFSQFRPAFADTELLRSALDKTFGSLSPEVTKGASASNVPRRSSRFPRSETRSGTQTARQPRQEDSDRPPRPRPPQDGQQPQRRRPSQASAASKPKPRQVRRPPPQSLSSTPAVQVEDVDLSVFEGAYHPTFSGAAQTFSDPKSLFGSAFSANDVTVVAESGKEFSVAASKAGSFHKGGYDVYIKAKPEDFGGLPDRIGPVKIAQRTLSHQRHFSLPAKAGAVDIITRSTPKTPLTAKTPRHTL